MSRRHLEEKVMLGLMLISTVLVLGSLLAILAVIFQKGVHALNLEMLTQAPKGGYYLGKEGGILNAILGSLVLAVGATLLAVALSLPAAMYLRLHTKGRHPFATFVRFSLDVLWGIPSIVYGAFGFAVMVLLHAQASLLAGICTVTLLIIPIMTRGMDEVLKMIPGELEETALALGSTRWEIAGKVLLRQALPGLVTAVLIAFGRGIGDAASVLFTAGFTDYLPYSFFKPVATLPLAIFFQLGTPFPEVQQRGYASALVATVIVLAISILSRIFSRKYARHRLE